MLLLHIMELAQSKDELETVLI